MLSLMLVMFSLFTTSQIGVSCASLWSCCAVNLTHNKTVLHSDFVQLKSPVVRMACGRISLLSPAVLCSCIAGRK